MVPSWKKIQKFFNQYNFFNACAKLLIYLDIVKKKQNFEKIIHLKVIDYCHGIGIYSNNEIGIIIFIEVRLSHNFRE